MEETVRFPRLIRFGTFELDPQSGELRKSGLKLKLTGLPFQVLAILLEQPGVVVTREELQKRLWPDTFVDVDHSLNTAINKIREVLGDSAESPRFVETLPRRGYRFIAPVEGMSSPATQGEGSDGGAQVPRQFRAVRLSILIGVSVILAAATFLISSRASRRLPRVTASTQLSFSGRILGPLFPPPLMIHPLAALATDGNRVYFSASSGFTFKLAYVSTAGGDIAFMEVPLEAELRNISPDGEMLLAYGSIGASEENHLWLVPTAGGGPRRLGAIDGQDGAWSPDGRHIVYADGNDLYLAERDGNNGRKLVTTPGKAFWIGSPNATRLRFTLLDSKTKVPTLWECRTDGTNLHRLALSADDQSQLCCGEWTPDGRYFLFRALLDRRADFWLVRDTHYFGGDSKATRLTNGPLDSVAVIPSHNGKRFFALEAQPKFELQTYDLKTRRLTPLLAGVSAIKASVSPNAQWIAWVETRDKETILWRSKRDGSERLQLTAPPLSVFQLAFAPDGKQIAFTGRLPDRPWRIFVVPLIGGEPEALTPDDHNAVDPSWSPDGHSLMFGGAPDDWEAALPPRAISILNLNSKQFTLLPHSEGLFSPQWSPNGRYVVAKPQSQPTLLLFDFATQNWTELLSPVGLDFPFWSNDSEYVYFNDADSKALMRVVRASRKVEELLDLRAVDPNALSCLAYAITPDGAIEIVSSMAGGDIHALDVDLP